MLALVKYVIKIRDKGVTVGDELAALYAGELNPVAAKAQRKVPVPEGSVIPMCVCVWFSVLLCFVFPGVWSVAVVGVSATVVHWSAADFWMDPQFFV